MSFVLVLRCLHSTVLIFILKPKWFMSWILYFYCDSCLCENTLRMTTGLRFMRRTDFEIWFFFLLPEVLSAPVIIPYFKLITYVRNKKFCQIVTALSFYISASCGTVVRKFVFCLISQCTFYQPDRGGQEQELSTSFQWAVGAELSILNYKYQIPPVLQRLEPAKIRH